MSENEVKVDEALVREIASLARLDYPKKRRKCSSLSSRIS